MFSSRGRWLACLRSSTLEEPLAGMVPGEAFFIPDVRLLRLKGKVQQQAPVLRGYRSCSLAVGKRTQASAAALHTQVPLAPSFAHRCLS